MNIIKGILVGAVAIFLFEMITGILYGILRSKLKDINGIDPDKIDAMDFNALTRPISNRAAATAVAFCFLTIIFDDSLSLILSAIGHGATILLFAVSVLYPMAWTVHKLVQTEKYSTFFNNLTR